MPRFIYSVGNESRSWNGESVAISAIHFSVDRWGWSRSEAQRNGVDHSDWICPVGSKGCGVLYRDFHHGLWSLSISFFFSKSLPAFKCLGKLFSFDWYSFSFSSIIQCNSDQSSFFHTYQCYKVNSVSYNTTSIICSWPVFKRLTFIIP